MIERVRQASGGLPLAIQWVIGSFKRTGSVNVAVQGVGSKDSPVLEFSFRNIWNVLSLEARSVLAVTTIFDAPPTAQELVIALEWSPEKVEGALAELQDVTLVTKTTQPSDGRVVNVVLPITSAFARYQLGGMGDLEVHASQRVHKFEAQMGLQKTEVREFESVFDKHGMETPNEKRAAILCKRAESEAFVGNPESARSLFAQARLLAPQSAYVLAMSANFELRNKRLGEARQLIKLAVSAVQKKKTGAFVHSVAAQIADEERDRLSCISSLRNALECDPSDLYLRHRLGVALSRAGKPEQAIEEFDVILRQEENKRPVPAAVIASLKTRIINLNRLGRFAEAKADLAKADKLIAESPHLEAQAAELESLRTPPSRSVR